MTKLPSVGCNYAKRNLLPTERNKEEKKPCEVKKKYYDKIVQ